MRDGPTTTPASRPDSRQCLGGQDTGDLGDPGALAVSSVGVDRVGPHLLRDGGDRSSFLVADRPADRELAAHRSVAQATEVGEELPGAAGAVGPDQDRGAMSMVI